MAGFTAEPDDLHNAAAALRRLAAEQRGATVARYSMSPHEAGNDELTEAITDFLDVSEAVQRRLPDDLDETAQRLTGNAAHYTDLDQNLAADLRRRAHGLD